MHSRENAARLLLVLFVLCALLVGLVAGCGGGDQAQGGGQEKQQGEAAKQGGEAGGAEASETKIAFGTIRAVKPDKGRISLRPTAEAQGEEFMDFKVAKDAQITLDGKDAEVADIKGGQQAKIEYVDNEKGISRVKNLELFQVQRQD